MTAVAVTVAVHTVLKAFLGYNYCMQTATVSLYLAMSLTLVAVDTMFFIASISSHRIAKTNAHIFATLTLTLFTIACQASRSSFGFVLLDRQPDAHEPTGAPRVGHT